MNLPSKIDRTLGLFLASNVCLHKNAFLFHSKPLESRTSKDIIERKS